MKANSFSHRIIFIVNYRYAYELTKDITLNESIKLANLFTQCQGFFFQVERDYYIITPTEHSS